MNRPSTSIFRRTALGFGALASVALAFVPNHTPWPAGEVLMHLQLGADSITVSDGSANWDGVAQQAVQLWEGRTGVVDLRAKPASDVEIGEWNGFNNIYFADTIYGDGYDGALAVTLSYYEVGALREEADILVNTAYNWDSYRGPLRKDVEDLRRVLVHELGHVLGLGHPDEWGQDVDAIMNSTVSDTETLQTDDIQGISFNYSEFGNQGGVGDQDDHGGLFATATDIVWDGPNPGHVESWDLDMFRITVETAGGLTIWSTGDTDTYAALRRSDGALWGFNDEGGEGHNFRILAAYVEPGTYFLKVEGWDETVEGDYTVFIEQQADAEFGDAEPSSTEEAGLLDLNAEVAAQLNFTFDIDLFRIEITERGALTVLTTGDTDTIGRLLDSNEQMLEFDDDGGDDLNFRYRSGVLEPGTYYVEVSSLLVGAIGDYVLSTQFQPAGELTTEARLMNLSVRTNASGDFGPLILGFVTTGASKTLLVRGVGPSLGEYGIADFLGDPRLTLFDAASEEVGSNDDWLTSDDYLNIADLSDQLGAFELTSSLDSALIATPGPGSYSVHVVDYDDVAGQVLVEAYDADGEYADGRLVNLSTRTKIGAGGSFLTAGFVIGGEGNMRLLIRGVGPQLGVYGVEGALENPRIELFNSSQEVIASNDDWGDAEGEVAATADTLGAFPLNAGSADAALLVELPPGPYSVQLKGAEGEIGDGLIEIYEVR